MSMGREKLDKSVSTELSKISQVTENSLVLLCQVTIFAIEVIMFPLR